jgi:hypothetical protein
MWIAFGLPTMRSELGATERIGHIQRRAGSLDELAPVDRPDDRDRPNGSMQTPRVDTENALRH